jgi:hypothetical protein
MASLMMTKTLVNHHGLWVESEYATLLRLSLHLSLNSLRMYYFAADGNFEYPACGATGEH